MSSSSRIVRVGAIAGAALAGVVARDLRQRQHAIVRNFPVVGHFRYLLESVGPELRQYIVTSNDEERPFSRDQRRWVYASSKRQINTFGFGTDNEMEEIDSLVVFKHSPFPVLPPGEGQPGAASDHCIPAGFRGRRGSVHELVHHGVDDRLAVVAVREHGDAPTAFGERGDEGSPAAVGAVMADHADVVVEGS